MKFTVKPEHCDGYPDSLGVPDEQWHDSDKFAKELAHRALDGFCMGMYVQLQSGDVRKTPIEDGSKEWQEKDAPWIRVATLEFLPQIVAHSAVMCDQMVFNPWHAIVAHRPLGHQNRARRWVYHSSRQTRHGHNAFPDASYIAPASPGSPLEGVEIGGWEIE